MLELREIPREDIPKSIKSGELIAFHGNHFLLGNSGYSILSSWKNAFQDSESGKPFAPPVASHGGGTLTEYIQNSSGVYVPVTLHGVRGVEMPLLSYQGEETLHVPRGKFAIESIDWLQRRATTYAQGFNRKALFIIEKENLGESPDAMETYEHYRQYESQFDAAIFSTHAIDKHGDSRSRVIQNLRFIDGSAQDFLDIVKGHAEEDVNLDDEKNLESALIYSICSYIVAQIAHIEREAPQCEHQLKILGHCDLIKLAIHRLLVKRGMDEGQRKKYITELFQHPDVKDLYSRLFSTCREYSVAVELNVAGFAKNIGVYPSREILEIAHDVGSCFVLASDAHSLQESLTARTDPYIQAVLDVLPQGASLHTVA